MSCYPEKVSRRRKENYLFYTAAYSQVDRQYLLSSAPCPYEKRMLPSEIIRVFEEKLK